jgi:two-component system, OmpR family, phosphate regulon sensor histidine kinase PhoR
VRLRAAHQLFLSYLLLIVAVVTALSIGADSILRRHLVATATDDLNREVALGRVLYESVPQLPPDSVANLLASLSGRRVTIVAPGGRVIGDSRVPAADLPAVANHLDRPEVQEALQGATGHDQRISRTIGVEHIYSAVLSARGDVIRFAFPTGDLDRALGAVQRTILTVGLAGMLLAGLFSYGFSLIVTRPLRSIAATARAMSSGLLSQRIRTFRGDELGDLADALNTLADELQRQLGHLENERTEMQTLIDSMTEAVLAFDASGHLRRANPAARRIFDLPPQPRGLSPEAVDRRPDFLNLVRRAVEGTLVPPTELTHQERQLLASAHPLPAGGAVVVLLDVTELRRLEGVRRDFVANASHELKTPLTAIRGYSETLLDEDLPPELRRQFAETVRTNAERLQRIVDDLLDLSRLESGGWKVAPEPVDLARIAFEVWHGLSFDEGQNRNDLRLEIDRRTPRVHADANGLRQILTNLFTNARRYTPDGGSITLRAGRADDARPDAPGRSPLPAARAGGPEAVPHMVSIEVIDTGIGIPSQHLPRIFERFYRVDPARSRVEGGTGLGLAIVKHLVEAHGGQVGASSVLGSGTTVHFTLPAA